MSNELDIHEKLIETITTNIFYFKSKVGNKNDMTWIVFDFVSADSHSEPGCTAQHATSPADHQRIWA